MRVGYVRVSTPEQNTIRQETLMDALGVDRVFIDQASGSTTQQRGQLQAMLAFVRDGDTVVVESISRFARNTRDLLRLVDELSSNGVEFVSIKENIDTTTPTGKFMLTVFGAVAELERDYLLQRQREGIEEAKRAGKYTGRKPIEVNASRFRDVYRAWKAGEITAVKAQRLLGLTSSTFYRKVKEYETEDNNE